MRFIKLSHLLYFRVFSVFRGYSFQVFGVSGLEGWITGNQYVQQSQFQPGSPETAERAFLYLTRPYAASFRDFRSE